MIVLGKKSSGDAVYEDKETLEEHHHTLHLNARRHGLPFNMTKIKMKNINLLLNPLSSLRYSSYYYNYHYERQHICKERQKN